METKTNNQEIDLLELLARIFKSLKENWVITVLLPLSGVIIGVILYRTTPPKIVSNMMVISNVLTETECDFLLGQLEQADSLKRMKQRELKGLLKLSHKIQKDIESKNVHVEITIQVRDRSLLGKAQDIIIQYLEGSDQAIKRKAESGEFMTQMIVEIDRQLQSIEEVKNQFDNKTKATFLNPSDLFTASLSLNERKIDYQIRMKDIKAFRLVQGFDKMSKEIRVPLILKVVIGFIGGTIALMMVLFAKFFRGYYKRYQQTHPV